MPSELQLALWGLAVLLPFCINVAFGRDPDGLGLSGMMVVGWAIERLCWAIWSPPEAMQFYAPIDLVFGSITFSAWLTERRRYKAVLVGMFLFQCALHAAFWMSWPATSSQLIYITANNITFAVELCIIAVPGVASGVARLAGSRMFDRPWLRDHAGP